MVDVKVAFIGVPSHAVGGLSATRADIYTNVKYDEKRKPIVEIGVGRTPEYYVTDGFAAYAVAAAELAGGHKSPPPDLYTNMFYGNQGWMVRAVIGKRPIEIHEEATKILRESLKIGGVAAIRAALHHCLHALAWDIGHYHQRRVDDYDILGTLDDIMIVIKGTRW